MKFKYVTFRFRLLVLCAKLLGFRLRGWRVGLRPIGEEDGWVTYERLGDITVCLSNVKEKPQDEVSPPTADFAVP